VSLHRYMEGWVLEPGAVGVDEFAKIAFDAAAKGKGYWAHLLSWWGQRDNPDVLLLTYEHMIDDPETAVRRLAAFAGVALDDALLRLTLERSSFAYRLAHKDHFDEAMLREMSETRAGLPPGSDAAKVRQGGVGGHRDVIGPELSLRMDQMWAPAPSCENLTPRFARSLSHARTRVIPLCAVSLREPAPEPASIPAKIVFIIHIYYC